MGSNELSCNDCKSSVIGDKEEVNHCDTIQCHQFTVQ